MRSSHALASVAGDAVAASEPTIVAMRRTIDDKFPYLAFAVQTRGLPFYEVLLTTDTASFTPEVLTDAAVRDRQPADRFYSSRKDSGLISAETESYSVPAAVLQRFARAGAIYYTVIAFADRQLTGGRPAADAETLRRNAPQVSVAPGFTGATLGMILAVPVHRLRTVPFTPTAQERRDANDLAGGEDGYRQASAYAVNEDEEPGYGMALEDDEEPLAEDAVEAQSYGQSDDDEYDDGFNETAAAYETPEPSADESEEGEYHAESSAVDDEDADDLADTPHAAAYDSTFSPGESMPAMLQDADHDRQDGDQSEYDDGYSSGAAVADPAAPLRALTIADRRLVIETVGRLDGAANPYATVRPPVLSSGVSSGVQFGQAAFTAASGNLGRVLQLMKARHPATFAQVFGPDAEELLRVTSPAGPETDERRRARVQPVAGQELHQPVWAARFAESARPDLFGAGQPQLFNGAQNELASELFLDPMLPIARWLDLTSDRALALLFDLASRIGVDVATRWVAFSLGPVQSPSQRQQALAALGFPGIREFQTATPGTETDGVWGPRTHAAMVGALRRLGTKSPLPIAGRVESINTLVRVAPPEWVARARAIVASPALTDTVFAL